MPLPNGLYKLTFRGPTGQDYGVAYLHDGRWRGGDSGMAYVGTYTERGGWLSAELCVTQHRHVPGVVSALGYNDLVVLGAGHVEPDGTLTLSQLVDEAGKPRRQRTWSVREVSPGWVVGTLSDAAGSVTGQVIGSMLQLRFRMKGGLRAEQRLYLQPDGRTVLNRMKVRKLGIVVGALSETIRKTD